MNKLEQEFKQFGISLQHFSLEGIKPSPDSGKLVELWKPQKIDSSKPSYAVDQGLIFVIMAFNDEMTPVFDGIASAAIKVGLTAKRVIDVIGDYRITDQIIQMIHSARFIVADLTLERPNVYFELGYARGIDKTVITTVRRGTNVHFDVKDWTYIEYTDSRVLEKELIKRLEIELSKESK